MIKTTNTMIISKAIPPRRWRRAGVWQALRGMDDPRAGKSKMGSGVFGGMRLSLMDADRPPKTPDPLSSQLTCRAAATTVTLVAPAHHNRYTPRQWTLLDR
jgi:hypothetical protein